MQQGEVPLERPNTLGVLLCPLRRPTVIERWSPYEIACFEGAITLVGKKFYEIAKVLFVRFMVFTGASSVIGLVDGCMYGRLPDVK